MTKFIFGSQRVKIVYVQSNQTLPNTAASKLLVGHSYNLYNDHTHAHAQTTYTCIDSYNLYAHSETQSDIVYFFH